jgi:hypothetical protein
MDDEVTYTSWWATDGSLKPKVTAQRLAYFQRQNPSYTDDPYGYMALVPCLRDGERDGPGRVVRIELTTRSPSQLELLSVLCAHVVARADGEVQPLIYTDCQDTDSLLDLMLGRRVQRVGRRGKFRPLPELVALLEALGGEVDYVHSKWLPRRHHPALVFADNLANHARDPRGDIGPDDWSEVDFNDVLHMAHEIKAPDYDH